MRSTMTYRGYTGSIEYSEEDEVYFGRVLGIRSLLLYEGDTVDELERDFREFVNDYILSCEERGVEPEKPTLSQPGPSLPQKIMQQGSRVQP